MNNKRNFNEILVNSLLIIRENGFINCAKCRSSIRYIQKRKVLCYMTWHYLIRILKL